MRTARRESAADTCGLIVGLVKAAAGASKTATAKADYYLIHQTPLRTDRVNPGCVLYAERIVK